MPHQFGCKILFFLTASTFIGTFILIYFAFFDQVIPLNDHRLLFRKVHGSSPSETAVYAREFCFSQDNEASILRIFRRIEPNGFGVSETFEAAPVLAHLDAGCNIRMVRTEVPRELGPGEYSYRGGLRWCNGMGRCQTIWLPEIDVTVEGECDHRKISARLKDDQAK